jgi:retron-type reverse transcriptase
MLSSPWLFLGYSHVNRLCTFIDKAQFAKRRFSKGMRLHGKGKFTLEQTTKAQRKNRGMALLFL